MLKICFKQPTTNAANNNPEYRSKTLTKTFPTFILSLQYLNYFNYLILTPVLSMFLLKFNIKRPIDNRLLWCPPRL